MNHTFLSDEDIKNKVKTLGLMPMAAKSHGFKENAGLSIAEAAEINISNIKEENAAIAVMGVVLGANRDWGKQVVPHKDRLNREFPNLNFLELQKMLNEHNYITFGSVWGHKDEKKYKVLKALVEQIVNFGKNNSNSSDFELMKKWVNEFNLDLLSSKHPKHAFFPGAIPNFGIASFQHLRITFGVDTVKPDQRVREVLKYEFGMNLSPEKAIAEVERIARIVNCSVIYIDQVFVKYGSGYPPQKQAQSKSHKASHP